MRTLMKKNSAYDHQIFKIGDRVIVKMTDIEGKIDAFFMKNGTMCVKITTDKGFEIIKFDTIEKLKECKGNLE